MTPQDWHSATFAAQKRIAEFIDHTPLVEDTLLNETLGGRLLIKMEALQRGGSFKMRGAANAMLSLSDDQRTQGVVAYSSGNHAVAVATAARRLAVPAVLVMPRDAPYAKRDRVAALGAELILYDRLQDDRNAICRDIAAARGLSLIRPFDDLDVIAGQATAGLEIAGQVSALGSEWHAIAVPCSGGAESICDALLVPTPGRETFPILLDHGARGVAVSDDEVMVAIATIATTFGVVVEPGGAAAVAAVLSGKIPVVDRTVVAVCSGRNIDTSVLSSALMAHRGAA